MKFINGFERALDYYAPDSPFIVDLAHRFIGLEDHKEHWYYANPTTLYGLKKVLQYELYDGYDTYLSTYCFKESKLYPKRKIGGIKPVTATAIRDKIYWDIDPVNKDPNAHCLDLLPRIRVLQKDIPVRVYATGRGFQIFADLDNEITLDQARILQVGIAAQYNLPMDPEVLLTNHRVFRIPFTKNRKNDRWCIPVQNKYDEFEILRRQEEKWPDVATYVEKHKVNSSLLTKYLPAEDIIINNIEKIQQARAVNRRRRKKETIDKTSVETAVKYFNTKTNWTSLLRIWPNSKYLQERIKEDT